MGRLYSTGGSVPIDRTCISRSHGALFALGCALFFVSGIGALIVETTWLRWFRLLLGATAPAASATLVAFFTGQAVGAALGARLAARWRRPLRAYGGLEAAARAHLSSGGIFCQWLPLYQLSEDEFEVITATFLDVFPRAGLFRGDFFGSYSIAALVGYTDRPAPANRIAKATARLERKGVSDRWVTDPLGLWALYLGPLGPLREALADLPRNGDDRPEVEFRAARSHAGGSGARKDRFTGLAWIAFAERLRAAARQAGDDLYPDLPEPARRAAEGGHALQAAGALFAAGRTREASRALAAAAERVPLHLLAEAPPDPTAAEVWSIPGQD
jgi:hypothetical protein